MYLTDEWPGHMRLIILEIISDPARLLLVARCPSPYRARSEATAGPERGEAEAAAVGLSVPLRSEGFNSSHSSQPCRLGNHVGLASAWHLNRVSAAS